MKDILKTIICAILIMVFNQLKGQIKQVIGSPIIINSHMASQFIGDKISINRNDGIAIVSLDGQTLSNKITVPSTRFQEDFSIDSGVYFAKDDDAIVLKDLTGKILGDLRFEQFQPFITDNTLVKIKETNPMGDTFAYIDLSGKEIIRFDNKKYNNVFAENKGSFNASDRFIAKSMFLSPADFPPYSEGLTAILNFSTDLFGFINTKFQLVIPAKYKIVSRFSEGLAAVQDEVGNWGYINTKGEQIIPFTYSLRPSDFSSGLAKVKNKEGNYGFINKKNELIIPAKYEFATNFYKGRALARESYDNPVVLLDSTGTVLVTFPEEVSYIDTSEESSNFFGQNKQEKPFYIPETLKQLVDHGKGIFKNGSYTGLIDINGKIIIDFKYALLSDYHEGKMFAYLAEFINGSTQHLYGILDDKEQWQLQLKDSEF